jgi:hypothetical protein
MTRARASSILAPAFFFLAWALLFTYPLVTHMGDGVVLSTGDDAWLHLWDLWWADKSLVDLHTSPYFTYFLYHPTGVNLVYHSLDIFNGVLSIPLQHLLGLTWAFNLLLLANLTLDGLAAYWLCLERTGSVGAALVGGALFASAPLLGTSVNLGQLDEVTVWWLPLYILALYRALDSPGMPWQRGGGRRATLCAGICLVGASLATWYFTAGLVVFTVLFVPAYLVAPRRDRAAAGGAAWWQAAAKVGAVAVIFVLALSPLLVAMIRERLSGATYMLPSYQTTLQNSADLAGLFLPGRVQVASIDQHGSNVALGLVGLALALVALVKRWKDAWPVALALLGLVLMSLGPHLQLLGTDTQLPMPYALLNNVPFIGASRQPLRFVATAGICISLLAAFGTAYLLELAGQPTTGDAFLHRQDAKVRQGRQGFNGLTPTVVARPSSVVSILVVSFLLLLTAFELFGIPRSIASTSIGPAYTLLRDAKEQGAVMELPYSLWQARPQFYQSVTGRPVLGGYTSRHYPYPFIEAAPGAAQLADGFPATLDGPDIVSPTIKETALPSLDYYGVRYVVLHKADLASGRFGRLVGLLKILYPNGPVYQDKDVAIYETPAGLSTASPTDKLPLVGLGRGWYDVEANPTRRWTGSDPGNGDAYVWVGIRPAAAGNYKLNMTTFAYGAPRHLSIVLDGKTLFKKEIGLAPENLSVDLGNLPAGDHGLVLKVDEQPTTPPGDRRPLSMGVTKLEVAPQRPGAGG